MSSGSERKEINFLSSRAAPRKFVPWSLHIKEGLPQQAINCRKAAMNVSVVRSDANSR